MRLRRLMASVVSVALATVLLAPALPAGAGGDITIGIHVDEGPLTPYGYTFGNPGLQLVRAIYDTLFIMNLDREPEPWMVKDYQVSEDGLTWTLTLHEGITFHDGKPLTSRDVEFTYNYMKGPSHAIWQGAVGSVTDIETPDEMTVVFHLENPVPLFPQRPLAEVPILPAHIWEGVEEPREFSDATGSGPFQLVEYRSDQYYRLEAHPDYFHPDWVPALESITMPIIPDQTTLFSSLRAGEVDMATREIPPELVEDLEMPGQIELAQGPSYVSTLLLINNERPPFDQVSFRKALSLAIDAGYLVDTLRLGYGLPGSPGFVHPHSPWLDGSGARDSDASPDPEGAGALLDDMGFADITGDGYREDAQGEAFKQTILVYADRPERVRAAEIIAEWLEDIGLRTEIQAMEAGTVDSLIWPEFDVAKGRDFDLALWGWSAGIQENPFSLREVLRSGGSLNVGAYSHPDMDRAAERLGEAEALEDISPAVTEMAQLASEQVPFVTLWYPDNVYGYRPEAYDDWTFVTGVGILDKLSLLAERTDQEAVADPEEEAAEGSVPWFWLAAAAILVAIYLYMRRR